MFRRNKFIYSWIGLFLFNFLISIYTHQGERMDVIRSDAWGYYQYLPAVFIEGDYHKLPDYVKKVKGNPYTLKSMPYGIFINGPDHRLDLFQYGVALLITPFFLIAHTLALLFKWNPSGFSAPYIYSIFAAASFYISIAILLLFRLIKETFSSNVALVTVLCLYFGTNLFYYSMFENGMSHIYSFCAITFFVFFVPRLYESFTYKNALLTGLILGIIAAIRPYNASVILYFVLYNIYSIQGFKERIYLLVNNYKKIGLMMLTTIVIFIPQLSYWYHVTGEFIVFTYALAGQGFDYIANPQIFRVFFDVQNGWLVYSPIMLFSIVGLSFTIVKKKYSSYAILLIFALAAYLISSWWCWSFGGAFGHRAFIEYYPLLAIPFAYLVSLLFKMKNRKWLYAFCILSALLIFMNIRLSFLYSAPWDGEHWTWQSLFKIVEKAFYLH